MKLGVNIFNFEYFETNFEIFGEFEFTKNSPSARTFYKLHYFLVFEKSLTKNMIFDLLC